MVVDDFWKIVQLSLYVHIHALFYLRYTYMRHCICLILDLKFTLI